MDEFLRTGRLGSVTLGMDRAQVRTLLGAPTDTAEQGSLMRGVDLWVYDSAQLAFWHGRLNFIGIYFETSIFATPRLLSEPIPFSNATTFDDFDSYLTSRQISHTIDSKLTFDTQLALSIGRNVWAFFQMPSKHLQSIQAKDLDNI